MSEIAARRREYLRCVLDEIEEPPMPDYEKVMRPLDRPLTLAECRKVKSYESRLWAINHSPLTLGRDIDKANRYFESAGLDPRLMKSILYADDEQSIRTEFFLQAGVCVSVS